MSDSIRRGTVVLVPFPFTDLSSEKLRPAVVISNERMRSPDVCATFITSQPPVPVSDDVLEIQESDKDFLKTGLKCSSYIRSGKIATLDRKVLLGELGSLSPRLLKLLDQKLRFALDL